MRFFGNILVKTQPQLNAMMNEETQNSTENDNLPITEPQEESQENLDASPLEAEIIPDSATSEQDWKAKYDEQNDKYLRLYSEFDNYRKRTLKERSDWNKMAGEDVFKAILPVVDDLERAIRSMETVTEIVPLKEGVELIFNKLKNALTAKGLEAIDSIGQPFDAEIHEALTSIPAPSENLKGKVVDEIEKCYKLNGKVIRWAKVVVGN
jgi:molecular chaperone GrpE